MPNAKILIAAGALLFAGAVDADEPFIADAKAGAQLRSMYFERDLPANVEQQSWAAGGWVWGRTGYWRNFLQFGGTVYASLPLIDPDHKDGGLLLRPGQNGYAVLGEAYARLKYSEQMLTLYRQRLGVNPQTAEGVRSLQTDLNYLGSRDIRMTPLTYEVAMFNGKVSDSLRYQAGYVDSVKDLNSDRFVSMSRLAGVTTRNAGMWTGGVQWEPQKDLWVQGFYYSVADTLRITYADVDWVNRISKDSYYRLAAQYTDQRSEGANLLTGRYFKTLERRRLRGVRLELADPVRQYRLDRHRSADPHALQLRPVLHLAAHQGLQSRWRGRRDDRLHVQTGATGPDRLQRRPERRRRAACHQRGNRRCAAEMA